MTRALLCGLCSIVVAGCATQGAGPDRSGTVPNVPPGLHSDCVSAAVVGLSWSLPGATRSDRYEVVRDGTSLGVTTATSFADTTVGESTRYSYSVQALGPRPAGAAAASAVLELNTPAASASGDAPYCPSKHLEAMSWDWSSGFTQPNGSDLWPVTWGRDGKVYAFFGDGGGFGGDNNRGRASFGIATLTHPPPLTTDSVQNLYGGYNSPHPSTLNGKAGAIIAVGSDFYTLGGLYTPAEVAQDYKRTSGAPPGRIQLAYSKGNAYSWRAAPWVFCSGDGGVLQGRFCANGFINFGRGNAGAPDGRVYLLGYANSAAHWKDDGTLEPATTYLARVSRRHVLDLGAYTYFAGLDAKGRPIWSADQQQMQPIFSDRNTTRPGCKGTCPMGSPIEEVAYNRALGRYIGVAQGNYVGQTSFYDAPQPWGPWTTISYNNIDPASGSGGWANLGTTSGEGLGVHVINAWTSPDGLTLWLTYSSDGKAPPGALFPPAGTQMDSFNLVSAHLSPGPALRGVISRP